MVEIAELERARTIEELKVSDGSSETGPERITTDVDGRPVRNKVRDIIKGSFPAVVVVPNEESDLFLRSGVTNIEEDPLEEVIIVLAFLASHSIRPFSEFVFIVACAEFEVSSVSEVQTEDLVTDVLGVVQVSLSFVVENESENGNPFFDASHELSSVGFKLEPAVHSPLGSV